MPSKPTGAKKRPAAKGLVLKEAAAKEAVVKSSTRKATRGKENRPPVVAAPVVASSASVSAPTSVRSMRTAAPEANQDVAPTATVTAATLPTPEDAQSPEVAVLCARLAVMVCELSAARGASTSGSNKVPARVEHPKPVGTLKEAMSISDDRYRVFCKDVAKMALTAGLKFETHWVHHNVDKIARAKKNRPYLKCYMGDWPIKEYLKRHFNNQRSYKRKDIWDFGSADEENSGDDEQ
ncbi:hypothetical protein F5888DRAFT_1631688 [Russula emetica]|nr:hypothetical protein F5888DRAFT_1631688 [Russula emetica]